MRPSTLRLSVVALALFASASAAQAAEVSFISGLYKTEENKSDNANLGKKNEISVGGRFSDQFSPRAYWFGQARLSLKSYSKGDQPAAPDDSTSIALGGGVRYYFRKLSENVSPFAYGLGEVRNEKDGEFDTTVRETETNGLYYSGHVGVRLSVDTDFFIDLETSAFDSALFATEKETTTTTDATGAKKETTVKHKRTELYADTAGAFNETVVAIGMRF
jgi:hypothetical protein